MADPPTAADERTTLEAFLDQARAAVRESCADASEPEARRVVSHLLRIEACWFEVALRGEKEPWADADVPLAQLLEAYDAQCERSRAIARTLSLDTAVAEAGVRYSVRWILLHMLRETWRELGHLSRSSTPPLPSPPRSR